MKAIFLTCLLFLGSANVFASPQVEKILDNAHQQTQVTKSYDPAYVKIAYPNGDVPLDRGVCTDVIVRTFRSVGVDLQRLVHEDMKENFSQYPKKWGLKRPDRNIDHRRVPNLMTYFKRRGKALPITQSNQDYLPGDIVAWRLDNGLLHIGLIAKRKTWMGRPLVVHNIGAGTQVEDILFTYEIIGHYRYF